MVIFSDFLSESHSYAADAALAGAACEWKLDKGSDEYKKLRGAIIKISISTPYSLSELGDLLLLIAEARIPVNRASGIVSAVSTKAISFGYSLSYVFRTMHDNANKARR